MPALDNARHESFCQEYVIDLNGQQAAERAGYSAKTAAAQASRLLKNVNIAARIEELQAERSERTQVDADYVLTRLHDIDQMDVLDILTEDMRSFKDISDWPKVWRISISGIDMSEIFEVIDGNREMVGVLKKIKWPDKTKNLELLGKHVNIGAFRERQKIESDGVIFNMNFTGTDDAATG